MSDDRGWERFEDRIRAALAADQPLLGAPAGLHARVMAVPEPSSVAIGRRWWAIGLAASLTIGAALVVRLGGLQLAAVPQAGGGPAPTFDPAVEGVGVRFGSGIDTLHLAPGIAIAVLVVVAFPRARRWWRDRRWRDALPLVAIGLVIAGLLGLAEQPGFAWRDGMFGPVVGLGVSADPPPGSSDAVSTYYITAEPRTNVAFVVSITNTSALPIRLDGLVEDAVVEEQVGPYWTQLALPSDPHDLGPGFDKVVPFAPVVVQPGDQQLIYVVGRAGSCSFGPTFALDRPDIGGYLGAGRDLQLAYSIFGLEATSTFELPAEIVEPQPTRGCP
jgi:hypothetical protein